MTETKTPYETIIILAGGQWAEYGLIATGGGMTPGIDPSPGPSPQPVAQQWRPPVDDSASWYCAVWHDPTGARNGGYKHTGIDLNLCKAPFGDVERGYPVFSIGPGVVEAVHTSAGWLGVTIIRHEFEGRALYVRYAHLDSMPLQYGQTVKPGDLVGKIANWTGGDGGDHLHFDIATGPYTWSAWLKGGEWIDPVPVLEKMLGADVVKRMLEK